MSQGRYARFCKPMSWQFIDTQDGRWIVNCALDGPSGPSHWMAMPTHFDNPYLGAPLVALVVVESETPQLPEDHTWRQASMARAARRQQADGSGQLWHTFADKDNQYPPF